MELLTLTQVFGSGALQNENTLVIQKSSLLNLTPFLNNNPESLLVAILITALLNFQGIITDENNQALTDEKKQFLKFDNSKAFELIAMIQWLPFLVFRENKQCLMHQIILNSYVKNQ